MNPTMEQTITGPRGGYLLIEYLIYIAVLAVVMEVAFSAFYRCLDNSRDLARNSEDILRVLRVGEVWRADIRGAVAPPRIIVEGNLSACEIPQTNSLIVYLSGDGSVWRKQGEAAPREVLPRVKASRILKDAHKDVTSWRWELELATRKKVVRLRPLFTFEAVPAHPMP
jgi:type II secretory pathway component PulJ